ncbi:hydrolase [Serratia marcescens]|uniref:Hydrolase n=2 Tax=Serratia marcescens TaxID=615 RepID=A0ABD5BH74_SERMA|nr:hydrolase [Serratia marcescens]AUU10607.1 hydrolase [Serratia marcescens]MCZ6930472.1 hydrolase [Serratia marcescens]MDE5237155.1 hydrolase [Serratia marcescens]MDE5259660.1 hydrolase [Serratia marcescens]MDQ9379374.1 hydrolase [Serratia marcescens]
MPNTFRPLTGASNPHLQTLLPRLVRRRVLLKPHWQRLELPDGDFVDLAWSEDPAQARDKPRAVLFHGLEGSFYSPYAHGLLNAWRERGWLGVVMHFRGCSGVPNRKQRIYHSGETEDARFFLRWLRDRYGEVPTAAVGISLGGNMLACYLAQQGADSLLQTAVVVSAPLMLEPCAYRMEQGFSRVYQRYLLGQLKQNATRKLLHYPDTLPLKLSQLNGLRRIREFDDAITSRIHGFSDATDYYRRCSALPLLPAVQTPLLIIHAKDDPFMTPEVIPDVAGLPRNIEYQLTEFGGHVGFVGGTLKKPYMWLEHRIPAWLSPYLDIPT